MYACWLHGCITQSCSSCGLKQLLAHENVPSSVVLKLVTGFGFPCLYMACTTTNKFQLVTALTTTGVQAFCQSPAPAKSVFISLHMQWPPSGAGGQISILGMKVSRIRTPFHLVAPLKAKAAISWAAVQRQPSQLQCGNNTVNVRLFLLPSIMVPSLCHHCHLWGCTAPLRQQKLHGPTYTCHI